ncbi:hypothetical protein ANN_04689 [Periplaneta americana]|uniref:Uncharacterized protein n=1 Tax=Periplaneta americana TaxID=6978 RepID=A0ABQ8T937_PERAM|nr:hypothetical protein ANN_04689 [Periplaneta americana]
MEKDIHSVRESPSFQPYLEQPAGAWLRGERIFSRLHIVNGVLPPPRSPRRRPRPPHTSVREDSAFSISLSHEREDARTSVASRTRRLAPLNMDLLPADAVSTPRIFRMYGIGDGIFGEMGPRIRHELPDIRLAFEKTSERAQPENQHKLESNPCPNIALDQ